MGNPWLVLLFLVSIVFELFYFVLIAFELFYFISVCFALFSFFAALIGIEASWEGRKLKWDERSKVSDVQNHSSDAGCTHAE